MCNLARLITHPYSRQPVHGDDLTRVDSYWYPYRPFEERDVRNVRLYTVCGFGIIIIIISFFFQPIYLFSSLQSHRFITLQKYRIDLKISRGSEKVLFFISFLRFVIPTNPTDRPVAGFSFRFEHMPDSFKLSDMLLLSDQWIVPRQRKP